MSTPAPAGLLRTLGILAFIAMLLPACAPTQNTKREQPAPPDAQAQAALERGDNIAAAEAYQALADGAEPPAAARYRLAAADALLRAGRAAPARELLEALPRSQLDADLARWRVILEAGLDSIAGADDAALRRLARYEPETLPPAQLHGFYRARARALEGRGEHLEAARSRVALAPLIAGDSAAAANRAQIWALLEQVPAETLRRYQPVPGEAFSGWVELASVAQTRLHRPAAFQESVAAWQERYPGHPAGREVLARLVERSKRLAMQPDAVAVLMPLSGRLAEAGRAVLNGLLSAWFADPRLAKRPVLRIYDTGAERVGRLYEQAVAEGAELVIGPLEKASVQMLAARDELPVTLLALNTLDEGAAGQTPLYQFGLSPEQQATQVAERAWQEGHSRALALSPRSDWGERVLAAFRERWEALGGRMLEHVAYDPAAQDFATPTKVLLNVDGSEERARALRRLLRRELEFEVRRRQDADFVFLAAFPVQARQIRPQLQFFRAVDLPVYATSHVYTGTIDRERDRDMEGVRFVDMPWLISPARRSDALFNAVVRNWSASASAYPRLYALGIDAYHIIPHLGRLEVQRQAVVEGQTGTLRLDAQGRFLRRLEWAEFVDGEPRPLASAPLAVR